MLNVAAVQERPGTAAERLMKIDFSDLDLNIARTRIVLSVVGWLSIYIDPTVGEPFSLETHMFAILSLDLAYSVGTYVFVRRVLPTRRFVLGSAAVDILFATVIALFTEGPTSPGLIFFAFAIIAVGCRTVFATKLVNSAIPTLTLGLDGGLLYGYPALMGKQLIAIVATYVFCGVGTFVLLVIVNAITPLRASVDDERMGLDLSQHSEQAYTS